MFRCFHGSGFGSGRGTCLGSGVVLVRGRREIQLYVLAWFWFEVRECTVLGACMVPYRCAAGFPLR